MPVPREQRTVEPWPCAPVTSPGKEEGSKPLGKTACALLRSKYMVGSAGAGGSGATCNSSKYEEERARKTASARRGRARFTRAAAAPPPARDSGKDSDVSISSAELLCFGYIAGRRGNV